MSRWIIVAASSAFLLAGCQYLPFTGDKSGPKYNDAKTLPPLEVPPDLLAAPVQPGLQIPPARAAAPAGGSPASPAPASPAGFAVSERGRDVPSAAPAATQPATVAASTLTDSGAASTLRVQMPAAVLWPVVRTALQKEGFTVASLDEQAGVLETDWQGQRTGLSALLGSAVAPNAREKYIVIMRGEADGSQVLSARQIRQDSDPQTTGEAWTEAQPDAKAVVALLKSIQESIEQGGKQAALPSMKVERLRDQQGSYLVLSLPPEQAQARVEETLKGLGYQAVAGQRPGEFVVTASAEQAQKKKGILADIWSQLSEGVRGAFRSDDKAKAAQVQMRVRLSRDAQGPGSVLEVLPVDQGAQGAVERLLQQLAERLGGRSAA
ncbi:outer membrane protein assembly factor BamC [Thermithiobacillus tepidarius DSM 3134]|uniref:outer membrane protein assembly factor BamC n=1 Tax=Thermithiobacillus tepidarius TaxID=929 RepID=UPI0004116B1B|nr:outer membrane protein assembly factor BamC [Thermithiobacillus tepidarius]